MIIATADNHLGYRQYGLKSREIDIQNSFEAIIDAAINTSSDITISGDLLHSNRPTSQTMAFLKKCHFKMIKNNVTAFVISGNHDKSDPHWVSHFHSDIYGFRDIDNQVVVTGSENTEKRLRIRGVPFCNKEEWDKIVDDINADEPLDLVLMHQSFNEFTNFENPDGFSNESLLKLDPEKCPLIVVGDTHVTDEFVSGNGIVVVSPGSSETMSMSEDPKKHVFFLKANEDNKLDPFVINIPVRPCYSYDIPDKKELEDVIKAHTIDDCKNPIINIKCHYELQAEIDRLRTILSDDAIVRVRGYNPEIQDKIDSKHKSMSAEEILNKMVSTESNEFALAQKLINPDCDARFEIDKYIEERMTKV
tara:strand:+ start:2480 stop:3568 length:1089 start_codon:yes stop_codon:yes gene_type:complete